MPHQQIRMVIPAASPPDVLRPLQILANADISLVAAGGGSIEDGGEFAITIEDDEDPAKMQRALDLLSGFNPRVMPVHVCWLDPDKPGQLLKCIRDARRDAKYAHLRVRDVSITTERNARGQLAVQVFFEGSR